MLVEDRVKNLSENRAKNIDKYYAKIQKEKDAFNERQAKNKELFNERIKASKNKIKNLSDIEASVLGHSLFKTYGVETIRDLDKKAVVLSKQELQDQDVVYFLQQNSQELLNLGINWIIELGGFIEKDASTNASVDFINHLLELKNKKLKMNEDPFFVDDPAPIQPLNLQDMDLFNAKTDRYGLTTVFNERDGVKHIVDNELEPVGVD